MRHLKAILFILCSTFALSAQTTKPDVVKIIQRVDNQLSSSTRKVHSIMVVHGKRNSRKMESISYTRGFSHSFSEYLSPAREKGTKMLKLDKEMWIYSPSTDRIIMISGHMMRQSVMGSDLSYEDMMEDRKLLDIYTPSFIREENVDGRTCLVIDLKAKVNDIAYPSQRLWVDTTYDLPLKQQMFAKSGELLKQVVLSDIQKRGKRFYPMKMNYKDMLKDGKGTDWIVKEIEFDIEIPTAVFTKASLKR